MKNRTPSTRLWSRLLASLTAPGLLALAAATADEPPAPREAPAAPAAPAPAALRLDLAGYRHLALEKQPALAAYRASVEAAQAKARGLDNLVLAGLVRRDLPTRRKQAQL